MARPGPYREQALAQGVAPPGRGDRSVSASDSTEQSDDAATQVILASIEERLGRPDAWPAAPSAWVGEAEAALIDAVLSTGGQHRNNGAEGRAAVARWRLFRGDVRLDDLSELADVDARRLAAVLQNAPGARGPSSKGISRAEAIVATATSLVDVLPAPNADAVLGVLRDGGTSLEEAVTSVKGVGRVTYTRFLLLLGGDVLKGDADLVRSVGAALGRSVDVSDVERILGVAARQLGIERRELVHALWSARRRGVRPTASRTQ
jgi:hypothetical protein